MNKRWVLGLAVLATLTACSRSTQLAVHAVSGGDGEEVGLAQQVIRLIPYDRDSIFNALASQAPEPEPQPPADLVALRDSVAVAQQRWTESEATWNDIRSELIQLRERMDGMDRSSNEYFEAFRRFEDLDSQLRRLERLKQQYFDSFTELQSVYNERADSFNAVLAAWEDLAFDPFLDLVDSLAEVLGEDLYDTTDASGWVLIRVPRGTWWIHTRSPLVFEELYWNLRYESSGGADTVVLRASNAEVRPVF